MAVSNKSAISILQISPDYSNATEIQSFNVYKHNAVANPIINIAFNCDGTRLLCTLEEDYYIKVFDVLPTGKVDEGGLLFITRQILSLACHPINPHVVCIGSSDGNVILVTILTSFNHTYILNKLYRSPVTSVAFHPGGDVIITGCKDGTSEMCEYDARTNKVTTIRRLGVAPSEPVLSVSANINFIAVLRHNGIDIYSYNWSRGERIRPAIRNIATALSQTQFGVTNPNRNQAKVQVAQNAQEYQSICLTGKDMTPGICAQAECPTCMYPFMTSDNQLVQPVFFHESLKSDGTVTLAHPIHMSDLLNMYDATSRMACPLCRKLLDITKSQVDTVSEEFNVRKAVSKIGSVFKGHKTRKSSQGRAAVVAVARERMFQGSRKAFIQQHRKEKADAVNAIARLTGVDAAIVNSVFENEWSRLVDYDDAIRSTTELLLAQKSQKQAQLKSEYLRSKQSK
jgi:WD40 repeat protein